MSFLHTTNHYSRPYRIPVPEGVEVPDIREFREQLLYEVCIGEYIAYKQGLPVTRERVDEFLAVTGWDASTEREKRREAKSLGNVIFSCTPTNDDRPHLYPTGYDLGTLARHFHLIDDMREEGMLEKDENGCYVIPLPFPYEFVWAALAGMRRTPFRFHVHPLLSHAYRCLQFLRPKDTSYYFSFQWACQQDGRLIVTEPEWTMEEAMLRLREERSNLTEEATLQFMREVSLGLDDETRSFYSKYTRLTGCSIIGPIVSYLCGNGRTHSLYSALELLLADRPSVYLYIACKTMSKSWVNSITDLVSKTQLADYGGNLVEKHWRVIQERILQVLDDKWEPKCDWHTYLRCMCILGWGKHFPKPDDFTCPKIDAYRTKDGVYKLPDFLWMTLEQRMYVEAASRALTAEGKKTE